MSEWRNESVSLFVISGKINSNFGALNFLSTSIFLSETDFTTNTATDVLIYY